MELLAVVAGSFVAITGIVAFVWQVRQDQERLRESFHLMVVARITGEAKVEMARITGEAKAELAQAMAKKEAEMAKKEAEMARLQGEAKAEMARLQDKDQSLRFFLQVFGTHDHEPLKEALFEMHNKKQKRWWRWW